VIWRAFKTKGSAFEIPFEYSASSIKIFPLIQMGTIREMAATQANRRKCFAGASKFCLIAEVLEPKNLSKVLTIHNVPKNIVAWTPDCESPDPMLTMAVAENGKENTIHQYNRSGANQKNPTPSGISIQPMGVTSKSSSQPEQDQNGCNESGEKRVLAPRCQGQDALGYRRFEG
jgi:hypothetical protein